MLIDDTKPVEEVSFAQEIHDKSFRELAEEDNQSRIEALVPPIDTPPAVIEKTADELAQEEQAEKDKALAEQQTRDAEIARRAADEVLAKQKEEENNRLAENAKEEERKRAEASLKPSWHNDPNRPKDEQGNPLPQTYDEIVQEAARIGKEQALAEIRAERAEQERVQTEAQQGEEARKAELARINKAREEYLDQQIEADLSDLYASGKLPRIEDENNPNDRGILAKRALFEAGARLNQKLIDEKKPPISSLKLIFYEHYQEPTIPAGAAAPVVGNQPPTTVATPDDSYDYARDHHKSPSELLHEMKRGTSRS